MVHLHLQVVISRYQVKHHIEIGVFKTPNSNWCFHSTNSVFPKHQICVLETPQCGDAGKVPRPGIEPGTFRSSV